MELPPEKRYGLDRNRLEQAKGFRNTLISFAKTDSSVIIRNDLGPQGSLENFSDFIEELKDICLSLSENEFEYLPNRYYEIIIEFARKISSFLNLRRSMELGNFDALRSQIDSTRQFINELQNQSEPYREIIAIIPYLKQKGNIDRDFRTDVDRLKNSVNKTYEDFAGLYTTKLESLSGYEANVKKLIDSMEESVSKSNLVKHSSIFDTIAESHKRSALIWLISTATTSIFMVYFSLTIMYPGIVPKCMRPELINSGQDQAQKNADSRQDMNWQIIIGKFTILAILAGSTAWMARNHRRNKHNEIVSNHRSATLRSFEQLEKVLGSKGESREAILLKSVDSIFQPVPTGYSDEEKGDGVSTTQILEILRPNKA